ncbi:MAG: Ig-like domain-containing protein [Flavipsychrobacter sp.]|nr:Ig-like domain-containing protein [Flavipsychrobacter sp.]
MKNKYPRRSFTTLRNLTLCIVLLFGAVSSKAQTSLYSEGTDLSGTYPGGSVGTISSAGTYTVSGSLSTPGDQQDWFQFTVGSGLQVSDVSYSVTGASGFDGSWSMDGYYSDAISGNASASMDVTPGGFSYPFSAGTFAILMSANYSAGNSYTVTITVTSTSFTNTVPTFVSSSPQALTVCKNASATSIVSLLHVSDVDASQTETWSQAPGGAPSHGTLNFTSATASSGSANITPGGSITYTPTSGYSGSDAFTVRVVDGASAANMVVNVTVDAPPAVTGTSGNSTICSGSNTSFGVTATGVGLTYQWKVSTDGGSTYNNLSNTGVYSNVTASTLNITAATTTENGYMYECVVSGTCTPPVTSAPATLTINSLPAITLSPLGNTICSGNNTSFSVAATGTGLTYQWKVSTDGGTIYNNLSNSGIYSNVTTSTLNLTAATTTVNGNLYECVVSGTCTPAVTSTPATLTIYSSPAVTLSPSDNIICSGGNTSFSVTATGAGLTYQWMVSTDGGANYSNLSNTGIYSNVTASTLNLTAATIAENGYLYECVINGTCTPGTTSTAAMLTVNPLPNVSAISDQAVCNTFASNVVPFSGSLISGTTYSWTNNTTSIGLAASGTGDLPSFTAVNTSTTPVAALITVTPMASGCAGPSTTFNIFANPTPTVTSIPPSQSVCNNTSTTSITFASSTPGATFAWSTNTPSIGLASSGTDSVPSFIAINTTNASISASVVVSAIANTCISAPQIATIVVNPIPALSTITATQTVCNNTATAAIDLTSTVTGTTYTWSNNTPAIGLGATGSVTNSISPFTAINTDTSQITATITVTPVFNGCIGTSQTTGIIINPTPVVTITPAVQSVCNSANSSSIAFTSSVAGTTYAWANDNTSTGLSVSGVGVVPSFTAVNNGLTPVTANITVTPTASTCVGIPQMATITVEPTPTVSLSLLSQTLCDGTATTAITETGTVSGTSYTWTNDNTSINLAASGTNAISSFIATNTTTALVTANITVTPIANSCAGTSQTATISVNPTPVATPTPASQPVCNSAASSAITFTSGVGGTTYTWTSDNTTTGVAASGTDDNIASFTATNNTTAPVTSTITVTATANGCVGLPQTATITVNPTPTVSLNLTSQTVCDGTATADITETGTVSGTDYAWTNDNTSINLAADGTNTISSFTATNTTSAPATANITVTPTANSCAGAPQIATIIVNPTPTVIASLVSQTVCNNAGTTGITFTSAVAGTTYTWLNDNISTSLVAVGAGNVPAFTAVNTSAVPIKSIITVTPSANTCVGAIQTDTITVNPTPTISLSPAAQTACNATATTAIVATAPVSGTDYTWTNDNTSINLASTGSGDIASFTAANLNTAVATANIVVTPTANGCVGAPQTAIITVSANPVVIVSTAAQSICTNDTSNTLFFSSAVAGATYTWTNDNTSIGLGASGSDDSIASFTATDTSAITPAIANISIIATANGCIGTTQTATIAVNPIPTITVSPSIQTRCNNATTAQIKFRGTVSNTTYAWTNNTAGIGIGASGTGNISSFTALNAGIIPDTAIITVMPTANGCSGLPLYDTLIIKPSPSAIASAPQTVCNGASTRAITFTGSPLAGTSYRWINSDSSIGLAGSGTGRIPLFDAVDTSISVAIVAVITVTPVARGCFGEPKTTTITINPTPDVIPSMVNQPVCNNTLTSPLYFTSDAPGTNFNWTNSNAAVGLSSGSGNGSIAPFMAVNSGTTPMLDTITVTPVAFGCVGAQSMSVITINPTPVAVVSPASQSVCDNTPVNITFGSAVTGTSFNWANSNTSVGLGATGTNDISFTAVNSGITPTQTTISVVPVANGCTGTQETTTITVNPTPAVVATPATQAVCTGTGTAQVNLAGAVSGTIYIWTNNNIATGLGGNGTGNIPSFISANPNPFPISSTVMVTPIANGCTGAPQPITFTVNPYPAAIASASANTSSCVNDSVILSSNTGTNYSYQWLFNGASISNASGSTYGAHTSGAYAVKITALGCASTSNAVTVSVHAVPPAPIYNAGGSLAFCPGDSVTLGTVISSNPTYTYQWQSNGNDIPGATGASYTTYGAGNYDVRVISGACTNTSATLAVTANPAPSISGPISAANSAVCPGGSDLLHLDSFTYNLYQWYRNNVAIPGATTSNYTAVIAGSYTVGVTNSAGCTAFTSVETITTGVVPVPVITQSATQLCTQSQGTYQWFLNGTALNGQTGSCITPGTQAGCYTVAVTNSSQCTGVSVPFCYSSGVANVTPTEIKLYPNPATNVVNISSPEIVNVTINSLDGKQLMYVEHATAIDISKLANTIYMLKVYDKNNTLIKVEKLVKTGW